MATGTVTETHGFATSSEAAGRVVNHVALAWTSDASGNVSYDFDFRGTIFRVATKPGTPAPTDDYDITVTDPAGIDVLKGGGANRDTANSEDFVPVASGSD